VTQVTKQVLASLSAATRLEEFPNFKNRGGPVMNEVTFRTGSSFKSFLETVGVRVILIII
jgi:hypothetical protein